MLSSVLRINKAIAVNIRIVRIFTQMREMLLEHKDLVIRIDKLEHSVTGQGQEIKVLFEYIKKLIEAKELQDDQASRRRIGYKKDDG